MNIRRQTLQNTVAWLGLLLALWPDDSRAGQPQAPDPFDAARPPRVALVPADARAWRAAGPAGGQRGWTVLVEPAGRLNVESCRLALAGRGSGDGVAVVDVVGAAQLSRSALTGPLIVAGSTGPLAEAYLRRTLYPIDSIEPDDELTVALSVNPWDPTSPMWVIRASEGDTALDYLSHLEWTAPADYEVVRQGLRVRFGRYGSETGVAGGVWRWDPRLDVDLRGRIDWVEAGAVRAAFARDRLSRRRASEIATKTSEEMRGLRARLGEHGVPPSVGLSLYADLEEKVTRTGDPRPSHLARAPGGRKLVHLIVPQSGDEWDRTGLARSVLDTTVGEIRPSGLADGTAVWLSGSLLGRDLDWWAHRLGRAGVLPETRDLLDEEWRAKRSYLVAMPAAALMVRRLAESRAPGEVAALLRDPVRVRAAAQEARQASVSRVAPTASRGTALPLAFQRGVTLAHEGYAGSDGYGSAAAVKAMETIRSMGADWVALTPYGFMREPAAADISFARSERQPVGSENDQALLATVGAAHRLGMRVMLKPQIWLRRPYWTGDIDMPSAASWDEFFAQYREFVVHYALLGAAGDIDLVVVGVELQATIRHETQWRSIIAAARDVYDGPITYAANWGEEVERIAFWDALDYVGLDCYYPLSADAGATDEQLKAGAAEVAARIASIARRAGRPVILTEVGFPALAAAWIAPHDERTGRPMDAQAQARAYAAVLSTFWDRPWLAGLFWWKWPTTPPGERHEPGFSPRGRPAEAVLADWYRGPRSAGCNWPSDPNEWTNPILSQP